MDETNELTAEDGIEELDLFTPFIGNAHEVVSRYTHCALCGSNLHFAHITDFIKQLTQETARCPECGVKVRKWVYRLQ